MKRYADSKSRTTLLCPITPYATYLGPITHHADNLGPITRQPLGKPDKVAVPKGLPSDIIESDESRALILRELPYE